MVVTAYACRECKNVCLLSLSFGCVPRHARGGFPDIGYRQSLLEKLSETRVESVANKQVLFIQASIGCGSQNSSTKLDEYVGYNPKFYYSIGLREAFVSIQRHLPPQRGLIVI